MSSSKGGSQERSARKQKVVGRGRYRRRLFIEPDGDPRSFHSLIAAYLEALRVRNYSEATIRSDDQSLGYFVRRFGDTRNKRLFESDKPPSVNLDGASFICVNTATLVGASQGGLEATWEIRLGALGSLATQSTAIRGSCGPVASYSSQLWSACS